MRGAFVIGAFVVGVAACASGTQPAQPGTAETAVAPAAAGPSTSQGTIRPVSTTTRSTAPTTVTDIIVVGDGLGATGAAIQAGRRGHSVVLLSPLGYLGGQAGAAGVTSFDDASGPARDLFRGSGLYAELFETLTAHYEALGLSVSQCYFSDINTFCPEPSMVSGALAAMLIEAGVSIRRGTVSEVTFDDRGRVNGARTTSGDLYEGLVIDGTEFGDLIPMTGAAYGIGNYGTGECVQDMTHAAVMAWYPEVPEEILVPPDADATIAASVGATTVDAWLDEFRRRVAHGGQAAFTGWRELAFPISPALADWYRGMPDTRRLNPGFDSPTVSGVNLANDVPVSAAAVMGGPARLEAFRTAILKTYLYMWYSRWELGRTNWAVATHLGYADADRWAWLDEIPDAIEQHMPPGYYIREARRLSGDRIMRGSEIANRGVDVYPDSVFIGGDRSDSDHGTCAITDSELNPELGPYDAPLWVFLPSDVDGFLVAVARNGNVDRSVASSIRMHAPELLGGQAVGMLAALAVEQGSQPRAVDAGEVREALTRAGAIVDVPADG